MDFTLIIIFVISPIVSGWLGFIIGLVLFKNHVISRKRSILWIVLSWGFAALLPVLVLILLSNYPVFNFLIYIFLPAVGWVGGTITGMILILEKDIIKPITILWIGAAWALGGAFPDTLLLVPGPVSGSINVTFFIIFIMASSIAAIGSYFMVWQIRRDQKSWQAGL